MAAECSSCGLTVKRGHNAATCGKFLSGRTAPPSASADDLSQKVAAVAGNGEPYSTVADAFTRFQNLTKPTGMIFDMDGTLADVSSIRHLVEGERKNFDAFHREGASVPANDGVVDLAKQAEEDGHAVIIVTARTAKFRPHTAMWLALNAVPSEAMFMRRNGDTRKDVEVKADILASIRKRYTVVGAVDDNPAVIELWEREGIPTTIIPGWNEE